MHPTLVRLGWDDAIASLFEPYAGDTLEPARVIAQHRGASVVATGDRELWAEPSGRLSHEAAGAADLPTTGDWVALRRAPGDGRSVIHAVLPRRTKISRKVAGFRIDEQVLAANVDVVFLVAAMDLERNAGRLERYLSIAWESGAEPVVVLTKADLCLDPAAALLEVDPVALGARVVVTSAQTGEGLDEVAASLRPNRTGALLGHSGVGKSSLINALCRAQVHLVQPTREGDARGRHTTTARELVLLPTGGTMIDTPGLREIQLWDDAGMDRSFEDIGALAEACRFGDCRHEREPGCAVLAAVETGALGEDRLERHRKMKRELAHLERRKDRRAAMEERRKWKAIAKAARSKTRAAPRGRR